MSVTVRLPGLTMNGAADGNGDTFRVSDIEGLDSADIDASLTDLAPDGVNVDYARFRQREILIRGKAWGPFTTEAAIWRVRQKIETALAAMVYTLTTVYFDFPSPGIPIQLDCRHLGKLHFPTPTGTVQDFEIPLTAPSPFKLGQTFHNTDVINNGTGTLTNAGNYPAAPVAFLQTTASGLWLQNNQPGGSRLTLDGSGIGVSSFPAGTYIDFAHRAMFVPGVGDADIIALPRSWWLLAPGANSVTVSGNWRFEFRDCFV